MVIPLQFISIIPYTCYSYVKVLATLTLITLLDQAEIYGIVIIYQLCYHDENIKPKRKVKYKNGAQRKRI